MQRKKNSPENEVLRKVNGTMKQGCQMVHFQTKNPNLGKFWKVLQWKMAVLSILLPNCIFYGTLVYFSVLVCCTEQNPETLHIAYKNCSGYEKMT
jgi:hypothetical protein